MSLYKVNDGIMNELDFVKNINRKKFEDTNYNIQLFLRNMYGDIPNNSLVKCYKNNEFKKIDILIEID